MLAVSMKHTAIPKLNLYSLARRCFCTIK